MRQTDQSEEGGVAAKGPVAVVAVAVNVAPEGANSIEELCSLACGSVTVPPPAGILIIACCVATIFLSAPGVGELLPPPLQTNITEHPRIRDRYVFIDMS